MQVGVLHNESIKFYVINSPNNPIILGLPWLCRHSPQISWKEGQITQWAPNCHKHCLTQISPLSVHTITLKEENPNIPGLPAEYSDLTEVFSKLKSSQCSSNCTIDLIPGTSPPKVRIFPLSQPESDSLKS